MKYILSFVFLCLLVGCQSKNMVVYVHQEGRLGITYHYRLYVNDAEIVSDSIQFSTTVPNFNSYDFKETEGTLRLSMDTLNNSVLIKRDAKYYSFFILSDTTTGVMRTRIIGKAHGKRPIFY